MKNARCFLLLFLFAQMAFTQSTDLHIRTNQLGYFPTDAKVAIAFSKNEIKGRFSLVETISGKAVFIGKIKPVQGHHWDGFHYYQFDFSKYEKEGNYILKTSGAASNGFAISSTAYQGYPEDLLAFMRQQRCGYNPFLDLVCHQRDGRSAYGPIPDGTFVDASGGWHDAGDQLKYLLTGSNATARMLLAYELFPKQFVDQVNTFGQPFPNGIPDILDEARWGLDWLHKLHLTPDQLIHQVADDRDHRGWKMPDEDVSDYGWGPNSYRVAYFATGEPQGLGKYKSEATGLANLAGRSAAAMAMAYRIWKNDLHDTLFAERCLRAAESLYTLGSKKEGYQQGNSYGAPYRYSEDTWADDMEWGATELYKATGDPRYLEDAEKYAFLANTQTSWMSEDTAIHYRFYPFVNVGHFALYEVASPEVKERLAGFYISGIEQCMKRAKANPYRIGVPFIWCSNNLVSGLITQIILYEKMTGDRQFHDFMIAQRDWLFGTNSWGTSMFTMIPRQGEYPLDVHTSVWMKTGREVPGGLIDGPLRKDIHDRQLGIAYAEADEFAGVQNGYLVYHDDNGDYATNEPTMDGTADAILMLAYWSKGGW